MMKKEFAEQVKVTIENKLNNGVSLELHEMLKLNDVTQFGLVFPSDQNSVSPVFYLDDAYDMFLAGDLTVEKAADALIKNYNGCTATKQFDTGKYLDWDSMKDKVIFKVVNKEANARLLKDVPHRDFLDLAVMYCCLVDDADDFATITIRNNLLEIWGITEDTLYQVAKENSPESLGSYHTNMTDLLNGMIDGDVPNTDMIVYTNKKSLFGASVVLYDDYLKQLANESGCNLYLLPSSVHEWIIVPCTECTAVAAELVEIVQSVNTSVLSASDFLSNNVYLYRLNGGKIEVAV